MTIMRLHEALKLVERGIDDGSISVTSTENGVALRCLVESSKRLLGARRALKQIAVVIEDDEHLNQLTLGLDE
jgi:hypothetical protein